MPKRQPTGSGQEPQRGGLRLRLNGQSITWPTELEKEHLNLETVIERSVDTALMQAEMLELEEHMVELAGGCLKR
jgi:hypothetical protein